MTETWSIFVYTGEGDFPQIEEAVKAPPRLRQTLRGPNSSGSPFVLVSQGPDRSLVSEYRRVPLLEPHGTGQAVDCLQEVLLR